VLLSCWKKSNTSAQLGRTAEQLAERYLRSIGYSIWSRNWRCQAGELDIVAQKKSKLVFFEVKSRKNSASDPQDAINYRKERRLKKSALAFTHTFSLRIKRAKIRSYRFDSISVIFQDGEEPVLRHSKDIFNEE
jgi:putative endonuclease